MSQAIYQTDKKGSAPASLRQLYSAFFRIGILTFGGGLAMLPMFRRECVQRYHWVTDEEMLDLYAISQCTPGIIAVNAATYIGFKERKVRGSISATLGVISPSVIIICIIAALLKQFIEYPIVQHAFAGIRVAVCAMLIMTAITVARKGIKNISGVVLFAGGFALACFTPIPLVLIVIIAGVIGFVLSRYSPGKPKTDQKEGQL